MSETLTPPVVVDPAPAPQQPDPAPPAAVDPPEEQTEEQKQASRGDKRFATLTAQLAAAQREQERQRAELEFYRGQQQRAAPQPDTPEAQEQQLRAQIRAEEAGRLRAERFHTEGEEAFPGEWQKKCADLIAMGADAPFASLLVEMPHGVRVAAALADEPDVLQRITSIRSERGRAIALGTYAAQLGNGANKTPPPPVSRAPAPIRPVSGRASPAFNEYTASPDDLVDHYLKQGRR